MVNRRRYFIIAVLSVCAITAAGAETLAVAVRLTDPPEDTDVVAGLLAMIEEGAMDTLFADGHIVFDIDGGYQQRLTTFQAIDQARSGGATYLVLIDTDIDVAPRRGPSPGLARVTVVDIESEHERAVGPVDPRTFVGADEKPLDALLLEVGARAAGLALGEIGEVDASW